MTSNLRLLTRIALPPGRSGGFDHGDVDAVTGKVFVAHTAFGTVDVIDGETLEFADSIARCPEGSGVLCASAARLVFAASRGSGKVLLIDGDRLEATGEIEVGPKPNGLAWAQHHRQLLVADVDAGDQAARLIDVSSRTVSTVTRLPGRPRWCVFDEASQRFLINIRDPASVACLTVSGEIISSWAISVSGPHGLDLDRERGLAFVACDGGQVVVIDVAAGRELSSIPISGEPDAIWFNPRRRRLYVGIANPGLLEVVDTEGRRVVESIPTEPGAKTSAFDAERQRLYVFLPDSCAAAALEES